MGRMSYQKSCGVVPVRVLDDGSARFLLLHSGLVRNPRAVWEFPKGSVEPGETDLDTALRECAEETGLTGIRIVPGYRALDTYVFHRSGRRIRKRVVYFLALVPDPDELKPEPDGREHILDAEGRWYRWLTLDEAHETLYHPGQRAVLASAYAHLRALGWDRPEAAADLGPCCQFPHVLVPGLTAAGGDEGTG